MKWIKFTWALLALFMLGCIGISSTDEELNSYDSLDVILQDSSSTRDSTTQQFETLEDYATITTKADLYDKFGANNINEDTSWYAEGELMLLTSVLTDPANGYIVRYVWQEEKPTELEMVEAYYQVYDNDYNVKSKQKVPTENGIHSGMTINELRKWNGAAFNFSGFGWDYGGGLFLEPGSKLAANRVGITLDVDYEANYAGMDELYGDIELSSDDATVKSAPIFINYINVYPTSNE